MQKPARHQWLISIILAPQEAEIRWIWIQSQITPERLWRDEKSSHRQVVNT
jgi:hypothetical protein